MRVVRQRPQWTARFADCKSQGEPSSPSFPAWSGILGNQGADRRLYKSGRIDRDLQETTGMTVTYARLDAAAAVTLKTSLISSELTQIHVVSGNTKGSPSQGLQAYTALKALPPALKAH